MMRAACIIALGACQPVLLQEVPLTVIVPERGAGQIDLYRFAGM